MDHNTWVELGHRYPQLCLPIAHGVKDSPAYRSAVLRGEPVEAAPAFLGAPEDSLTLVQTPAGPAELLFLANRGDFEHALRALAYRCEPVEIPASLGASTVRGLINWEKIRAHKSQWLARGLPDWQAEFRRFTADKGNYLDTLILLSAGAYSAVPAAELGLDESAWLAASRTIRQYHELTHFICRSLYPADVDALRDEVLADLIGLVAAFGDYDPALARRFLGVEGERFLPGGRLANYVREGELEDAFRESRVWIDRFASRVSGRLPGPETPAAEREAAALALVCRLFPAS